MIRMWLEWGWEVKINYAQGETYGYTCPMGMEKVVQDNYASAHGRACSYLEIIVGEHCSVTRIN